MVGVGRDLCGPPSPTPRRSRVTHSRQHTEEHHAPRHFQWTVCYLILLLHLVILHRKKTANTIFKVKIKSCFPRSPSTFYFTLNSSASYYTECNNPLFYKGFALSVLIFGHIKKRLLTFFPASSSVPAGTEGSHHQHRVSPFSPRSTIQLQLGEAAPTVPQVKQNTRSYSIKRLFSPGNSQYLLSCCPG